MLPPSAGTRSGAERGHERPSEDRQLRVHLSGGFPTPDAIERAHDDADLDRAIQAYRFFFPTVSALAMFKGPLEVGLRPNRTFGLLDTKPRHVGFTLNSDTPYGPVLLDLSVGPIVVELPPGPFLCAVVDLNQRWVTDMGVPGPDAGRGGKHLLLPPDWSGAPPDGYHVARADTYRVIVGVRAVPQDGDVAGAMQAITTLKVYPLEPVDGWVEPNWIDMTPEPQDTTPLVWETNIGYWRVLHEVIDSEPLDPDFSPQYGELAALGISKGEPFAPDERMEHILEEAARIANGQMRVRSFANRRPDRVVWPDSQWQWPALRPENGNFDGLGYLDEEAREIWFFQAIAASPAMFRRAAGGGSLYWLGLRDRTGAYLDGGKAYRLSVPRPVPAGLFWSITVYDAETRSQIRTDQESAALRSMFELSDATGEPSIELYFAPEPPTGREDRWIKTIPDRGWFVYFRIYGPEEPAFDGSWQLPDIEATN
jgi:hypothetical protein